MQNIVLELKKTHFKMFSLYVHFPEKDYFIPLKLFYIVFTNFLTFR